ncbi:hypothetical protein ACL9RF_16285 [Sphingobacterium sp. Mn56C]|uniref:hypothetical protein n=1 Tax=Sphingobacterium sp. Mn56C TaxID=3395261 RepID=UPI003BC665FD
MNLKRARFFALTFFVASMGLAFTSCDSKNDDPIVAPKPKDEVVISGKITSTLNLDASKIYVLKGYVQVMDGGVINIPAGTIIKGEKTSKAALIVERGGKINAKGTATNPIVFTSDQKVGNRNIGDWSGIIICGKSLVNTANGIAQYEGGALGADIANYGGGNSPVLNDNSGEMSYVRIEFAGIAIEKDKEINGLTLCAVGSGTKLDHIQVSYGGDDGFEFFGGTVNASHLIVYRSIDDDFDFDQGYNGRIQYGISIKDPNISDAQGTSRAIELENKGAVANGKYSRPVLANFTFIGPGAEGNQFHGAGIHFGLNSRMVLANSVIVNAKGNAVEFNSNFPAAELQAGRSTFANNIVFGNGANYGLVGMDNSAVFKNVGELTAFVNTYNNSVVATLAAAGLINTSLATPNLLLSSTSPAVGKAKWEGDDLSTGFVKETFAGAMGTNDWTKGWANWDPKNTDYSK